MKTPGQLLRNNKHWAAEVLARDPAFFQKLSRQQAPKYLWIGCSDSRVPANTIIGMQPGEVFVHRNVANLIKHADMNCLSAIQFAVDVLGVQHILICGHYGCSGVHAAFSGARLGLSDNWLCQVDAVRQKHAALLAAQPTKGQSLDRLCDLNVIEQVVNACETTVVRDAWRRGQPLAVHGWVYGLQDGLIRDLGFSISGPEQVRERYLRAVAAIGVIQRGAFKSGPGKPAQTQAPVRRRSRTSLQPMTCSLPAMPSKKK